MAGDPRLLERFASEFAAALALPTAGEWRLDPAPAGEIAWSRPLASGMLTGRMLPERKVAYLELFATVYFDPRQAAEFAIRELAGSYYRLQPHVRQ